jgi:hypothetical protein
MMRALRSKAKRDALLIAANGKCCICNVSIVDKFHADHIIQSLVRLKTSQFLVNVSILNLNYFQGVSYEKR